MRLRSIAAASLIAVVLGLLAAAVFAYAAEQSRAGARGPLTDPTDFLAFYCGGAVLAQGRDPYRAEPLRTCERRALAASHIAIVPHLAVPAPLPPYALAVFVPVSRLPFVAACVAFFVLSLAAIAAAVLLCLRLAKISAAFVAGSLSAALVIGSLYLGQIVPLVLVALCGCALALREKRFLTASLCALATMVEPHVGLAVTVGLFALEPRTRGALSAGMFALLAASLAAGGAALNLEYLTQVVPAHARSEAGNFTAQLSLTAAAYALGAGVRTALFLGEASYVLMIALGVALGGRLAATFRDRAFSVLTPAAAVLLGGVFVHDQQLAFALPFGFLLARYTSRPALAYVAVAVLAVPWEVPIEMGLVPFFAPHPAGGAARALAAVGDGSYLAETSWRIWIGHINARDARTPLEIFACKLPSWFSLYALGLVALVAVRGKPGHAEASGAPCAPASGPEMCGDGEDKDKGENKNGTENKEGNKDERAASLSTTRLR